MSMNEVAYYDCVPGLHCDDEHMLPDSCPYCRIAELDAKVERLEAQVRNKTSANQRWSDKVERLEKVLDKIAHDGCELVGDDYCTNLEGFDHDLWCHACIASEVLNAHD